MRAAPQPNRRPIARGTHAYALCGCRAPHRSGPHPSIGARRARRRAGLLPGATFALIVLFSVIVLCRPPQFPDDPQRRAPIASVAHYSFADFAAASR
ncbi:MAG: hypothetical protein NVS2B8_09880 [Vulcanimicrobiaceae bacterium]